MRHEFGGGVSFKDNEPATVVMGNGSEQGAGSREQAAGPEGEHHQWYHSHKKTISSLLDVHCLMFTTYINQAPSGYEKFQEAWRLIMHDALI